jgi:hypothetical protein
LAATAAGVEANAAAWIAAAASAMPEAATCDTAAAPAALR